MLKKIRPFIQIDTKFNLIPRAWLMFVEPKIERPSDSTCWLWQGGCDQHGEPQINVWNAITGKRTTKRLKVLVAEMFWEDVTGHNIVHECGTVNCLNPAHFYISMLNYNAEDRTKMIATKRRNISDYIKFDKK